MIQVINTNTGVVMMQINRGIVPPTQLELSRMVPAEMLKEHLAANIGGSLKKAVKQKLSDKSKESDDDE